jgi:hypothetical protein
MTYFLYITHFLHMAYLLHITIHGMFLKYDMFPIHDTFLTHGMFVTYETILIHNRGKRAKLHIHISNTLNLTSAKAHDSALTNVYAHACMYERMYACM